MRYRQMAGSLVGGNFAFDPDAPAARPAVEASCPIRPRVRGKSRPTANRSAAAAYASPTGDLKATIAGVHDQVRRHICIDHRQGRDGAAIGKYTGDLLAARPSNKPEWDGYGKPPHVKVSPYTVLVPKETEFEVKAGQNELNIELVPASAAR